MSAPIRHALHAVRRLRLPLSSLELTRPKRCPRLSGAPLTCVPREKPYADFDEAVRLSPRGGGRAGVHDWKTVSYRELIATRPSSSSRGRSARDDVDSEFWAKNGIQRAKEVMLRFDRVFPASVMTVAGDWHDEEPALLGSGRMIRVGDRFSELVDVLPFVPLLGNVGMLCVDEVAHVYDFDDRCGFTVVTTDEHDEVGEHSAWVRWARKEDGAYDGGSDGLVLESVSASTFKPHVLGPAKLYARWLQRRAHELGRVHLFHLLKAELMIKT
mmetsp:Transcript_13736/g.40187  ORF Transcript_13736/g.40187 Transcript_13736/m.40187 type:complete len:271 (-) Transcript_13736:2-814(-)